MTDSINPQYRKIWQVVQTIPAGNVCSYGQVADLAGLPGRARMVGKALGCVPKQGFNGRSVPWFRVLRSSGEIAFPQGSESFTEQRSRLMEEGVVVRGRRVSLKEFGWTPDLNALLFELTF